MSEETAPEVSPKGLTVLSASNAAWANAAHTAIDLDVLFEEFQVTIGLVRFTAASDGAEVHNTELWTKANAGDYGPIAEYGVPPEAAPDRVSANQFGKQLVIAGIFNQVQAWVAQQDTATQWSFNRSATFVRTDPMMQSGFAELGFTVEQIDEFFLAASKLGG